MAKEKVVKKVAKKPSTKKTVSKKTPVKQTYIALVIDRSGSMSGLEDAAVSAINEQIKIYKKNAKLTGNTFLTFIQFDDEIETLFDKRPIKDVKELNRNEFQPRNSTSMLDAVGTAIQNLETGVEETTDTGYLIVVVSDGQENSSRRYTQATLAERVKQKQATGNWTFTYLLANVDLTVVTKGLHIPVGNVSSFTSTVKGMNFAGAAMSASYSSYAVSRGLSETAVLNYYSGNAPDATITLDTTGVPTIDLTAQTNKTKTKKP